MDQAGSHSGQLSLHNFGIGRGFSLLFNLNILVGIEWGTAEVVATELITHIYYHCFTSSMLYLNLLGKTETGAGNNRVKMGKSSFFVIISIL